MAGRLPFFRVGSMYSNEEIYQSLEVGNAGGIRSNADSKGGIRRMVIMTSLPDVKSSAENPYCDRVEGSVLVYTAAGRVGNQTNAGQNAKIPRQASELFPIWAFQQQTSRRKSGPKRWKCLGLLQFLRVYSELQVDGTGTARSVFVFELRIHELFNEIAVDHDAVATASMIRDALPEERLDESDRNVETLQMVSGTTSSTDALACEEIRRELLSQPPKQFETTISDLLVRTGFRDVKVTRYSQDGGIDINARPADVSWPMSHLLIQVQAKRWMHTVGRREVAELRGSILPHSVGCIVTTSHFSKAAIAESSSEGKVPILLVNGHELAKLVLKAGLIL